MTLALKGITVIRIVFVPVTLLPTVLGTHGMFQEMVLPGATALAAMSGGVTSAIFATNSTMHRRIVLFALTITPVLFRIAMKSAMLKGIALAMLSM